MIEFSLADWDNTARKSIMNKDLTVSDGLLATGLKFLLPVSGMRFNLARRSNSGIRRRRNRFFGLD